MQPKALWARRLWLSRYFYALSSALAARQTCAKPTPVQYEQVRALSSTTGGMVPIFVSSWRRTMQISKDDVLKLLSDKGQVDQADQAEHELPDQVDPDQHADLLSKFGLDPKELLGKFGGGLHL
jgi:hypothetical protein